MKCPKCGYISFDHHDSCPKCKKNVSSTRGQLNLPGFEIRTPAFLAGTAAQAVDAGGIRIEEISGSVGAANLDAEGALAVDLEQDNASSQEVNGLSIDLSDLTLSPDIDDEVSGAQEGLDQLTDVESEIDLAIQNLETEDLLSVDPQEEPTESGISGEKPVAGNQGAEQEEANFTFDLEDLELELDLDGEGKK